MKSRLKKLIVAAAVSFAAAAPASAAITSGSDAELFLSVWDSVNQRSYVRDLNVTLNNFGTQNRPNGGNDSGGAATAFSNIMDNLGDSFTSTAASDAAWTAFMAGISSVGNLVWDVVAADGDGGTGQDLRRVAFTSLTNAQTQIALAGTQQNNNGVATSGLIDSLFVPGANVLIGGGNSGWTADISNAGYYNNAHGINLAGGMNALIGNTAAAIGQSMGFYYMTRSSSTGSAEAIARAYADGATPGLWNLAADGTLTYSVGSVAAVPEPGTLALFAAGALMLGGMARRRLS